MCEICVMWNCGIKWLCVFWFKNGFLVRCFLQWKWRWEKLQLFLNWIVWRRSYSIDGSWVDKMILKCAFFLFCFRDYHPLWQVHLVYVRFNCETGCCSTVKWVIYILSSTNQALSFRLSIDKIDSLFHDCYFLLCLFNVLSMVERYDRENVNTVIWF